MDITLRDFFKANALNGMLATYKGEITASVRELLATSSGKLADSMVAESINHQSNYPPVPLMNASKVTKWGHVLTLMKALLSEQSDFSQATFGSDRERGPLGPLDHLKKEVNEAIAAPYDLEERADMFLLLMDINRRAGNDILELVEAAFSKLQKNKAREWPKYEPWIVYIEPNYSCISGQRFKGTAVKGSLNFIRLGETREIAEDNIYATIRQINNTAIEHDRSKE